MLAKAQVPLKYVVELKGRPKPKTPGFWVGRVQKMGGFWVLGPEKIAARGGGSIIPENRKKTKKRTFRPTKNGRNFGPPWS